MAPALILTEEKAAEHGYAGAGPFTFGGVFPGVYFPGQAVAVSELGFDNDEAASEAFEAAWPDEATAPLEWTEVEAGEGIAFRVNHAKSDRQAPDEEIVEAAVEETTGSPKSSSIKSHADADAIALELGISFPDGAKLAEKIVAIEEVKAGAELAASSGTMVPADGAEDTTPGGPDAEEGTG